MLDKILVAIDESYASQCAFEAALRLAKALDAELLLVHILDVFSSDSPGHVLEVVDLCLSARDEQRLKDNYEAKMTELIGRYDALLKEKEEEAKAAGVIAQYVQPHGRPGPSICKAAEEHNIDLVVVGNRDRSTLTELVPGSVSNYVVHHAPCSVTIVHADMHKNSAKVQTPEFALSQAS